ncbi:hypothetical protein LTR47_010867 [Exophiala xenobiotica]|nr:hypothetical protein LTR92_011114 [Exophiala xenobiotica]KAK5202810.1 hypothetical protein LTR41_011440 [Exophiala xenobiotica]KAK5215696.1 hypothetical protein LTR72_011250 [Exophiala xenobiotica]KAK5221578.1 hypothetical protein LTR47_010867 [Exophiala xenobiotica]KAK5245443.1 hypothetical protein LTS06_009112 [Exophiala xenobiotica]
MLPDVRASKLRPSRKSGPKRHTSEDTDDRKFVNTSALNFDPNHPGGIQTLSVISSSTSRRASQADSVWDAGDDCFSIDSSLSSLSSGLFEAMPETRKDCPSPWATPSEAAAVTMPIDPEIIRQSRPAPHFDQIEVVDLTNVFDKSACLIKITGDSSIDDLDVSDVQGTTQDEFSSLDLTLGANTKVSAEVGGDCEMLVSNPSPPTAVPPRAEVVQSHTCIQDLSYSRPAAIDPEDNQWKIEKLLGKRQIRRQVQYLVKWFGYPDNESTWEPPENVHPDDVAEFDALHHHKS